MGSILTRKDYDFFEASSAFQKSIRKGDEKVAVYFGTEIAASGYAKYLWKRMMIIASEDIGLANDNCAILVNTLYNNWQFIVEKNHEDGIIPILHAILALVRSKKSRLVDNCKMWALKTGDFLQVPDYALDVHTLKGKKMGRDHKFFIENGQKLENETILEGDKDYNEFFMSYLTDYANGKCDDRGYNGDNVYHKNMKAMNEYKNSRGMFG